MTRIVNRFQIEYEEEGIKKKNNVRYCKKYHEEYLPEDVTVVVVQWERGETADQKGRESEGCSTRERVNCEPTVDMAALARVVVKIVMARYFVSSLGDLRRLLKKGYDEEVVCQVVGYRSATNKPKEKRLYYLFKDLLEANTGLRARIRWGELQERFLHDTDRSRVTIPAAAVEKRPEPEPTPESQGLKK